MPNKSERSRLFFALWPDADLAGQIHKAISKPLAHCDGKRVPLNNYHITLVFYGSADAEQRACLEQAADKLAGQSFQIELSQLGYWPKPRVIWLAPTELPGALHQLQSDLSQVLVDNCGYQAETRHYHPHLTLTRKSRQGPETRQIEAIEWPVKQFALVQSITRPEGAEYKVLKQWPLNGA